MPEFSKGFCLDLLVYELGEWRDRHRRSSVTVCPQKGNFVFLVNQTATMRLTFILLLVITQNPGHAAPAALSKEEVSNLREFPLMMSTK